MRVLDGTEARARARDSGVASPRMPRTQALVRVTGGGGDPWCGRHKEFPLEPISSLLFGLPLASRRFGRWYVPQVWILVA